MRRNKNTDDFDDIFLKVVVIIGIAFMALLLILSAVMVFVACRVMLGGVVH